MPAAAERSSGEGTRGASPLEHPPELPDRVSAYMKAGAHETSSAAELVGRELLELELELRVRRGGDA